MSIDTRRRAFRGVALGSLVAAGVAFATSIWIVGPLAFGLPLGGAYELLAVFVPVIVGSAVIWIAALLLGAAVVLTWVKRVRAGALTVWNAVIVAIVSYVWVAFSSIFPGLLVMATAMDALMPREEGAPWHDRLWPTLMWAGCVGAVVLIGHVLVIAIRSSHRARVSG